MKLQTLAQLDRYFEVSARGSTFGREMLAGLVTFLAMAYILFVNPDLLSGAFPGVHRSDLLIGTALAAALGSAVMGIWGKYPYALAPGMGLNAFFAFTLVGAMGMTWQQGLACVFVSGIIFIVIGGLGIRTYLVDAIPYSLKMAITGGIGFFIAFIGLKSAGLIISHPATLVALGAVTSPEAVTCLMGLLLIAVFTARGVPGAVLLGIAGATAFALAVGFKIFPGGAFGGFAGGIIAWPGAPETFLQMDFGGALANKEFVTAVLMVLFVDFFDTTGTLFGLSHQAHFLDGKGRLPRAAQAFMADGIATAFSAVVGTSPTTTYIESAAGVSQGGRTGLAAVTVALCFVASIFLYPLLSVVPAAAVAPALIMVGVVMMGAVANIKWHDMGEALPAFLVLLVIPLSFSIAEGIAFGIVSYCVVNLFTRSVRHLNSVLMGLGALCVLRWIYLV